MEWQRSAPPGWERIQTPSNSYPLANQISRESRDEYVQSGDFSARMTPYRKNTSIRTRQVIPIQSDKSYFLSAYVRTKGVNQSYAVMSTSFYHINPKYRTLRNRGLEQSEIDIPKYTATGKSVTGSKIQTSNKWKNIQLPLQNIPESADALKIHLSFHKRDQTDFRETQVWFDEIRLTARKTAGLTLRKNQRIYRTGQPVSFIVSPTNYSERTTYQVVLQLENFYGKSVDIHQENDVKPYLVREFTPVSSEENIEIQEQFYPQEPGFYRIRVGYFPKETRSFSLSNGSPPDIKHWTARSTIMVLPKNVSAFEGSSWINPVLNPFQSNPLRQQEELLQFLHPPRLGWVIWNLREGPLQYHEPVGDQSIQELLLSFRNIAPSASNTGFLLAPPPYNSDDAQDEPKNPTDFTNYFLPVNDKSTSYQTLNRLMKDYGMIVNWILATEDEQNLINSSAFLNKIEQQTKLQQNNTRSNPSISVSYTPQNDEKLPPSADSRNMNVIWLPLTQSIESLQRIIQNSSDASFSFSYVLSLKGVQEKDMKNLQAIPKKIGRILTLLRSKNVKNVYLFPFFHAQTGIWTQAGPGQLIFSLIYPSFLLANLTPVEGQFFSSSMPQRLFLGGNQATAVVWNPNSEPETLPLPTTDNVHVYRLDGSYQNLDQSNQKQIQVGQTPVFLSGFSSDLLKTYISIRFDPNSIRMQDSFQNSSLQFTNHFSNPVKKLEVNVQAPDRFSLKKTGESSSSIRFQRKNINQGDQVSFPFSVRVPKPTSKKDIPFKLEGELQFENGESRTLDIKRFFELKPPLLVEAERKQLLDDTFLLIRLTNQTEEALSLQVQVRPKIETTLTVPGGKEKQETIKIPLNESEQNSPFEVTVIAEETSQPYRFVSKNIQVK